MIDAARDLGVNFDEAGFEKAMLEQRTRARASWKGGSGKEAANPAFAKLAETFKTEPDFYHATCAKDARIEAILTKNGPVKELKAGRIGRSGAGPHGDLRGVRRTDGGHRQIL